MLGLYYLPIFAAVVSSSLTEEASCTYKKTMFNTLPILYRKKQNKAKENNLVRVNKVVFNEKRQLPILPAIPCKYFRRKRA